MDLSSALKAKPSAYSFNNLSLKFMKNDLTENRGVRSETVLYGEQLHQVSRKVPYLGLCVLTSL